MSLITIPTIVVTDHVDDDAVLEEIVIEYITDEIIVNDRIAYYWGV